MNRMMKKYTLLFGLLLLGYVTSHAQEDKHKKIKALKVEHITKALDLSDAEAEKFWPVYDRYEKRLHEVNKSKRALRCELNNEKTELSDENSSAYLDRIQDLRREKYELQTGRDAELTDILTPAQLLLLQKAEHEFKIKLLKEYRKK